MEATIAKVTLTDEQAKAIEFVRDNLEAGTVALSGPAGSGKTTLIKELTDKLNMPVTVSAMTNKAKFVLTTKGIFDAVTLHQACLRPVFKPPLDKLDKFLNDCKRCMGELCYCKCTCETILRCDIHGYDAKYIARQLGVPTPHMKEAWLLNESSGIYSAFRFLGIKDVFKYIDSWQPAETKDGLLIIDEASMLGSTELELAQKVFKKIVCIGDENQLPPVKSEPVFWQIATRVALTQIHRQAANSQPLQLADKLRNKQSISCGPVEEIDAELCRQGMPVIVWRNNTRVNVTTAIRKKLGYDKKPPQVGEVLICRNGSDRAAKARGLFNNSIWKIIEKTDTYGCKLENQAGEILENENVFMEELDSGFGVPFRFAYALTCHSAQGSEWPSIMIHEPDAFAYMHFAKGDEIWPWLYTACTRAKERVIWVGDK